MTVSVRHPAPLAVSSYPQDDKVDSVDEMDVSENNGTPKSSILIGFSIVNHPFWGTHIFGNTQMENIVFRNFTSQPLQKIRHRRFQRGVRMDDHLRFHLRPYRIHGNIMATAALYMSESCAFVCISWFHQLLRLDASPYKFQPQIAHGEPTI